MDNSSKKRKKSYYMQKGNKKACLRLDAGMKGFLITCNNNEKRAVMESYSILNEYADRLFGPQVNPEPVNSTEDDFEAEIRKEVEKSKSKSNLTTRRFQVVDTKTTNCVFIKTTVNDPNELISAYLSDVYTKKESKCRHILRIHPVTATCRAVVDKIEVLAAEVLKPFFQPMSINAEPPSYCIIYKVRNNSLCREDIIQVVGRVVHSINERVKVNFDNPDLVVSVDILQKFCCLSVMKDYFKYRKFNVQELCKTTPSTKAAAENNVEDSKNHPGSDSRNTLHLNKDEITISQSADNKREEDLGKDNDKHEVVLDNSQNKLCEILDRKSTEVKLDDSVSETVVTNNLV